MLLLPHYENVPFVQSNFYLQTDALTSVESAAPLPKDQRDMKVVQVLEISALSSFLHDVHVAHFSFSSCVGVYPCNSKNVCVTTVGSGSLPPDCAWRAGLCPLVKWHRPASLMSEAAVSKISRFFLQWPHAPNASNLLVVLCYFVAHKKVSTCLRRSHFCGKHDAINYGSRSWKLNVYTMMCGCAVAKDGRGKLSWEMVR